MKKVAQYSNDSISEYKGPESLRNSPQTLLRSADVFGALQTLLEIVANATDEFNQGFGKVITVDIDKDNVITVTDNGRGVPMGWSASQGKYNWDLVYNTPYASGKGKKGTAYSDSEGVYGCGCTATQYTSDFMTVRSVRNEKLSPDDPDDYRYYEMNFKEGYPVGELKEVKLKEKPASTGTYVRYRPSAEVFNGENDLPKEMVLERLVNKAVAYYGVKFVFTYKGDPKIEICYEGGFKEYLLMNVQSPVTADTCHTFVSDDKCNDDRDKAKDRTYTAEVECDILFASDNKYQLIFHNGALLRGGPTYDAVFTGIAKALTAQARATDKLGKKDVFKASDISPIVNFVCQSRCESKFSLFEHQTKDSLKNPSICKLITSSVEVRMTKWLAENPDESERIVKFATTNKTARENADKVRKQVIKQLSQDIRKTTSRDLKGYVDCLTKDPKKAELYIIEGESAKGNSVLARDRETQAIQALRGKILNCMKKPIDVLLAEGSIILQLLTLFGCGVELQDKSIKDLPKFDESKLNFDKIVLAADADVDGGHIIDLCITFIWVMCPTLLRNGHVYTVKTPLYKVSDSAHTAYFYSDAEKDAFLRKLEKAGANMKSVKIKRFKGLGEMESEELRDTIMDKRKRQLEKLQLPEDEREFTRVLSVLMGNELQERRELIINSFSQTHTPSI